MDWLYIALVIAFLALSWTDGLRVGVGRADITGPSAEVAFMGYAHPGQRGTGIHLRQFSRAFIIDDELNRLVFVNADNCMMGTFLRKEVLKRLKEVTGDLYTIDNVMMSGTHTHSTPGGYLMDIMFDINTWGFVPETFEAYAAGITKSILEAHSKLQIGRIEFSRGEILDVNINRSPTSYLKNPIRERNKYKYDVDKAFTQLKLFKNNDVPIGVITWFAVHATSMNNTNKLLSSDNMGLASILFEQRANKEEGSLVGQGSFVAAFASSNLGDVTPNIAGPRCLKTGFPCDAETSTCADHKDKCVALGPGKDMFESTHIIASRIMEKAYQVWQSKGEPTNGSVSVVHQYVHMPSQEIVYTDPRTGGFAKVKGCLPAMGYSFAAGTIDGPGVFDFKQGTNTTNPFWNIVADFMAKPSEELVNCQAPKPILIASGEIKNPFQWQPSIVSTQLSRIGHYVIACVPGEFTTMSGRRLRQTLADSFGISTAEVVIAGLCNTYSDYIATPEEYEAQRYEAASTIFGPYTLPIYLNQYSILASYLKNGTKPSKGPEPPEYKHKISLLPPVIYDSAGWGKSFGEVVKQPQAVAKEGEIVSVVFISGHPRNNFLLQETFLTVEKWNGTNWTIIANDGHWETKFIWKRENFITGTSRVEIQWEITKETEAGMYRIGHSGYHKTLLGKLVKYSGTSKSFKVRAAKEISQPTITLI